MKTLSPNEMLLTGGGRCGGAGASIAVEATVSVAGAFIGFGLSGGNPIGAVWGARVGFIVGGLICRS